MVIMSSPDRFAARATAAVALTAVACSGDLAGPTLVGDDLRVPLTAAIHQAERSSVFSTFHVIGVLGLVDLTIAQMVAAGTHDRSRGANGSPTDAIGQEHYDGTAFLIDYDVITPQGLRLTGQTLTILSWAGLDRNRGVAEALMDLTVDLGDGTMATGTTDRTSGFYFLRSEGRVWEIQPSTVELATLARASSPRPCRGTIPETVTCQVDAEPGRAAGAFELSAREIGPGTSPSNFHFERTAFDLPVTALRIVDTLRFAAP